MESCPRAGIMRVWLKGNHVFGIEGIIILILLTPGQKRGCQKSQREVSSGLHRGYIIAR